MSHEKARVNDDSGRRYSAARQSRKPNWNPSSANFLAACEQIGLSQCRIGILRYGAYS